MALCRNLQGRYLKFLNEYNGIQSKENYTNVTKWNILYITELRKWNENEEMIVAVTAIYAIA